MGDIVGTGNSAEVGIGDGRSVAPGELEFVLDNETPLALEAGQQARALLTARLADQEVFEDELALVLAELFDEVEFASQQDCGRAVQRASYVLAAMSLLARAGVTLTARGLGCEEDAIVVALATELAAQQINV